MTALLQPSPAAALPRPAGAAARAGAPFRAGPADAAADPDVAAAAAQAREALGTAWHLAVVHGPDAGLVLALPADREVVVGRGGVLTDPCVSRRHLRVRTGASRVAVADAGGTNPGRWEGPGRRRLGPRPRRWREGARLRLGESVLELRRRPSRLAVPLPAGARTQRLVAALSLLGSLAVVLVMVVALRSGGRGGLGAVMVLPVLLMALGRLAPTLTDRRRAGGRAGTGWQGREPDPPSLLLALAQAGSAPGRGEAERTEPSLAAWCGRRRRRDLLRLSAGEAVALRGAGAANAVAWWGAQVMAGGAGRVETEGSGVRATWGDRGRERSARLLAADGDRLPPAATLVRRPPRRTPGLAARWWAVAVALGGAGDAPEEGDGGLGEERLPDLVALEDVVGEVDRERTRRRWARAADGAGLEAVLGIGGCGAVRVDLVRSGPHALMAGTTGAGKSELLTSWLLQLALALPPQRLSFVLVDYKGGAAFGALTDLPHTAGLLTDLDPALTTRALTSLEAEVGRRERLLAEYGAKDLSCLEAGAAPARLVIAVDEFAALASAHPEVLEGLMRVAAQGRSLGIHLILATQRPAGAVSPAIRANTAVRVCLRVLDAADSVDVVGCDEAARLGPRPGRLVVRGVEGAEHVALQAPWCGDGARVAGLVAELGAAAAGLGRPWRPWAPPLPERVTRAEAAAPPFADARGAGGPGSVLLAVTDEPARQRTGLWRWRPVEPLLVLGSAGSGRSSALASAASGAARAGVVVHLCALPPRWGSLCRAPRAGTVVDASDPRRLARLWTLAAEGRLAGGLLVVDGADALVPVVDEALGPGEGNRLLEAMCRTAGATGTGLVVSAALAASTARWAAPLRDRLVLGAGEPAQAALAGLPRGQVTGRRPGHGVILGAAGPVPCQVVLPDADELDGAPGAGDGPGPLRLAPIPRHVPWRGGAGPGAPGVWAVGGDAAAPVPVPEGSVLVVGPPGSGRSTALRVLARAVAGCDAGPGGADVGPDGDPGGAGPLVVDDLDRAGPEVLAEAERALGRGRRVLASATTERAAAAYRGVLADLRSRGALVVLWPMMGPAAQVAGVGLRAVSDPRAPTAPGRGALVHRGAARPIQIADDTPGLPCGVIPQDRRRIKDSGL